MSVIGNILWFITGGIFGTLAWIIAGSICHITIIGIPLGVQCFKIAELQFAPFGKKVINKSKSPFNLLVNILWIVFLGWELALFNLAVALFLTMTIIGFPFAIQALKMARISFAPFGKVIVEKGYEPVEHDYLLNRS